MDPTLEQTQCADDPRLTQLVREYLEELEAGRQPDRRALAARHPELADALIPYLDALDVVHGAATRLQSSSHGGRGTRPAAEIPQAEPLGDFRIVREIGRGGMGVVYEAVQVSLGRRVALKVLPFAAALDAKQLQRFKNEAQAAAHLHHQNIVPVYAVGAERGVHYYAMQLIDGQNLAAMIDALRQESTGRQESDKRKDLSASNGKSKSLSATRLDRTTPLVPETRPQLTVHHSTQRSRRSGNYFAATARLIAQAAEGLEYAHGVGIVHRDIKPANLLIDNHQHVWITDFGLAQFHADAGLTQTGDLLGTLRYMSPEQAGGQRQVLDQRTDVYSLGATFYELLTLRPIFDGSNRQTLLRQILQDEPRPPRALDRSIPVELETIVLKATNKIPADRYASAREFADDLQRYLRNEPVLARRPTLVQRARKWLRRHPSVPVAAIILLVLMTAGSLVAAWYIQGEQDKTSAALQREQTRAAEAEERFQLARRAVDQMIDLAEDELSGRQHLERPRKQLLDMALTYYEKFIELRRDDPDAQADLAATKAHVKQILSDLAALEGDKQLPLLIRTAVREELKLTQEQRDAITALNNQREEAFRAISKLESEERREAFLELAHANEAAVAEILKPEQRLRFRQVALQVRGNNAFHEAEVIAALKLTAGQRERIRNIETEGFGAMDFKKPPKHGDPSKLKGGPEDPRKWMEQKQREVRERILALMTASQLERWRELTGPVFEKAESLQGPPKRPGPPFGP